MFFGGWPLSFSSTVVYMSTTESSKTESHFQLAMCLNVYKTAGFLFEVFKT